MMQGIETARSEMHAALRRVLELLGRYLAAQRRDGRHPDTDPLRGVAIEESEVEALVVSLAADFARPRPPFGDAAVETVPVVEPPPAAVEETPLQRAGRVFRMRSPESDALVLALAVELDQRFARLVAYLNDQIARTRPSVGLALAIVNAPVNAVELCQCPAIKSGFLMIEGDGPVSTRTVRVAPEFLSRLAAPGIAVLLPAGIRLRPAGARLDDLVLNPGLGQALMRWSEGLQAARSPVPLVLAGMPGSGRATAAQAASAAAGRRLVETDWLPERLDRAERLGVAAREALWHDATLLIRVAEMARDPELGELWALLAGWNMPVALAVPPGLASAACAAAPIEPAIVTFDGVSIQQREVLWSRLLATGPAATGAPASVDLSDDERQELAARYDFPPGILARAVRRAAAETRLSGGAAPVDFAALSRACRALGSAGMGPIAQRLPQPYSRDDLVLPKDLLDELDLAAAWMRNRRRVFEQWGFGRRIALGQGLTALFAGEPGTGKTMAAQVLAHDLGLELFRVDLSRVMSKYIGETEKNLSQLFDNARGSGAMLFFDEADVLFGKRTEVKDAHDRYANLEIGYLLQRMEEHTGTTVLATNRMGDLDDAFTRRFHFILDFPMPRPPERRRIWEGMLPREAERETGIDLDTLARDYEISGGDIRNSVLSAAFMAAEEGGVIGLRHLKRGLRRELLKTGRVLDIRQRQALEGD
ncbi:MAG TPA: ATP-binding protein [Stellaceae bacterium]|jgi:hypothetical protein|nr:ATP-binding protein [Stellaceae bacterium]